MSETALNGLLAYLYGTLTPSNMRWMAARLAERAKYEEENIKPFTKEEINTILDKAEADIAAGNVIDDEDVWRDLENEFARADAEEDTLFATSYIDEPQLEAV